MYSLIGDKIKKCDVTIAIIGLGYVGFPLAEALSKKYRIIGFDIDSQKIKEYTENGLYSKIIFSDQPNILDKASIYIITVPTPVDQNNNPDLSFLIDASKMVGDYISYGDIIIYESTVFPGATEEICIPILEHQSNLRCYDDFKVGYSPERLSPGDNKHTLQNVVKIVSGIDNDALLCIKSLYDMIIPVGTFPVSSIRAAEAIKVIENTQRDINIAFMNDMAMLLNKMNIDSIEVFDGMKTKWNSLDFRPGLVGGHCIGEDPYYLISKAKNFNYNTGLLSLCRKINNGVSFHIAQSIIKQFYEWKMNLSQSSVLILGITFKENCNDIRNSKVVDLYRELCSYGIDTEIYDPIASSTSVREKYNIPLLKDLNYKYKQFDAIVLAVVHNSFLKMSLSDMATLFRSERKLFYDVKGFLSKEDFSALGVKYMHL